MTDIIQSLPRGYLQMDFRSSSAILDTQINRLAQTVVERREQQVGGDFMRRFGGHSD